MKKFKRSDFDYLIEIKFEYKNQIITIKAEPFRTINYILEKAIIKMNKIIQLPKEINFYFLGKELNYKNAEKIGNIFNHREKVIIKMKSSSKEKNFIERINKNNIINKRNNTYLLNTNKILFQKTNDNNDNKEIKLPIINKSILKIKEVKIKEKENKNKNENICDCGRLDISEYCRNCRKFICLKCKTELKHKNHLTMHLNILNLRDNIKNYGKILQDEIQKKIEVNRNIFSKSEIIDEITIINRKQKIHQKYLEAIQNYQNIISLINSKLESENQERASLVINSYNEYSRNIMKQLDNIEKKLEKNFISSNKKLTFNDLRSFFDEINSKEESLNFFAKDIIKYHLKGEINTKFESSLNKIDIILKEMCDENSLFNLDNKYIEEIKKFNVKINNKENNSNNNDNINKTINNINIPTETKNFDD